jgi:hypothetical protein
MTHDDDKLTTQPENEHETTSQHGSTDAEQPNKHKTSEDTFSHQTKQNETVGETADEASTEKTWHNKNAIKRGIAMLGYGFIAGFVRVGITLIAIFQFFSLLFCEKPNKPLVLFGQNLNTYLYQINQFLTVNSEMYPFPFADWPDAAPKTER